MATKEEIIEAEDLIETIVKFIQIKEITATNPSFTSPFESPILFVKKANSLLRLCINYRALNSLTIKNRYPLLWINEMLDRLVNTKIFMVLDLYNTYY